MPNWNNPNWQVFLLLTFFVCWKVLIKVILVFRVLFAHLQLCFRFQAPKIEIGKAFISFSKIVNNWVNGFVFCLVKFVHYRRTVFPSGWNVCYNVVFIYIHFVANCFTYKSSQNGLIIFLMQRKCVTYLFKVGQWHDLIIGTVQK